MLAKYYIPLQPSPSGGPVGQKKTTFNKTWMNVMAIFLMDFLWDSRWYSMIQPTQGIFDNVWDNGDDTAWFNLPMGYLITYGILVMIKHDSTNLWDIW